jgi:hypothetical protein
LTCFLVGFPPRSGQLPLTAVEREEFEATLCRRSDLASAYGSDFGDGRERRRLPFRPGGAGPARGAFRSRRGHSPSGGESDTAPPPGVGGSGRVAP